MLNIAVNGTSIQVKLYENSSAAAVKELLRKLDYRSLKPVLFEMPTYEYLRTGDVIGKCMSYARVQSRVQRK